MIARLTPLAALLSSVVLPVFAQNTATESALPEVKITGAAEKTYNVKSTSTATRTSW